MYVERCCRSGRSKSLLKMLGKVAQPPQASFPILSINYLLVSIKIHLKTEKLCDQGCSWGWKLHSEYYCSMRSARIRLSFWSFCFILRRDCS